MRALVSTLIVLGCGGWIASPAVAGPNDPPRQPCVFHFGTASLDNAQAITSLGGQATLQLVGTASCNLARATPASMVLWLTMTGCVKGAGAGVIYFNIDGRPISSMVWLEFDGPYAGMTLESPVSFGYMHAATSTDLAAGYCFTGLALDGAFLFHTYAGTPADGG